MFGASDFAPGKLNIQTSLGNIKHNARSLQVYECMISSATRGAYNGACSGGLTGYLSGAMGGYMGGSVTGLAAMIRKFGAGLVQAGTFWKPEYI